MNTPYDATTQEIFLKQDVCSNFTGEHYHSFLYLKAFVGAENFIEESISENITRAKPPLKIRSSFVKLFTVSYPENCIKRGKLWRQPSLHTWRENEIDVAN